LRSLQSIKQSVSESLEALDDSENALDEEQTAPDSKTGDGSVIPEEEDNIFYEKGPKTDPNLLRGTRPARLRLIMPVGEGEEQELDLGNLFIATDGKSKTTNSHKKSVATRK